MNPQFSEQAAWVGLRLQDRVSYSGWFFALVLGLWLWAIMFRLAM